MRLIKPNFEIWNQGEGLEGVYKQIERAGRVCYKSEDKITETSAKEFVERMIKSGHGAMLEHGTVYLSIPVWDYKNVKVDRFGEYLNMNHEWLIKILKEDKYSKHKIVEQKDNEVVIFSEEDLEKSPFHLEYIFITTNYRVIIENKLEVLLQYLCEPTKYHEKRTTVRFICDRGVSHEFVRHRVFSFAQESTRYCNYSKSKFNNECTFIIPSWCTYPEGCYLPTNSLQYGSYIWSLRQSEEAYFELLHDGWIAQQARAVLPNALKTELVMTGFISDWEHFFKLRDAKSAHPQALELASPLHQEFLTRGYL